MTVRIPRGLSKTIEDFLKSEQASRMGYDSRADVVTEGVRRLLTDYGFLPYKKEESKE